MRDSKHQADYRRHDSAVKWLTRISWGLVVITITQVERSIRLESLESTVASIAAAAVLLSAIIVAHVAGRSISYQRLQDMRELNHRKHRSVGRLKSISKAMALFAHTTDKYLEDQDDMRRELYQSVTERLMYLLSDLEKPETTDALDEFDFKLLGEIAFEVNAMFAITSGWKESNPRLPVTRIDLTDQPDFIRKSNTRLIEKLEKLQQVVLEYSRQLNISDRLVN